MTSTFQKTRGIIYTDKLSVRRLNAVTKAAHLKINENKTKNKHRRGNQQLENVRGLFTWDQRHIARNLSLRCIPEARKVELRCWRPGSNESKKGKGRYSSSWGKPTSVIRKKGSLVSLPTSQVIWGSL